MAVHLAGDWGFVGSVNVNHISHGTQFVGSTGLVKLPDQQGSDWSSPLSFSMVFDQFTDSRVNGLYLNQLRFQLGYALNPCFEVGALYTEPANRDNDVLFVVPVFNFFTFGTVRQSQQIGGYAAGRLGLAQWSVEASFRDKPDTLALGGTLSAPLSDQLGTYVAANYEADPGTWAVSVGFEFRFGPSSRSPGWSIARSASYDVVRAQSPDPDFHLITVPPGPPQPVDDVMGEFERDQLNPEGEIVASSWTQRYYSEWLWRQGFISHGLPGRIWRDAGQHKDPSWDTWDLQLVGTDRIRRALK